MDFTTQYFHAPHTLDSFLCGHIFHCTAREVATDGSVLLMHGYFSLQDRAEALEVRRLLKKTYKPVEKTHFYRAKDGGNYVLIAVLKFGM